MRLHNLTYFLRETLKHWVLQVSKTLVLGISTAETLLLENTTVINTTSGYHPVFLTVVFSSSTDLVVVISSSTVKIILFQTQPRENHIWN